MGEYSYSRDRAIWKNKTAVEFLQTSNLSAFISWRDLITKLFIKNVFLKMLETIIC